MSKELPKTYKPAEVEPEILARWNAAGAFAADPADTLERGIAPYAIVIPPPNVTAALHMGHALNNTLQDVLVRWHRMLGHNTLWMPGTDHAGIATQTVVEKRVLQEEGKRRTDFTREEFVRKIQAWKDEYEATITNQLKTMGCSCDWRRQRFTMDETCAKAVREAFFRLFREGLIYRGKRLVNWDPVTQTALADDEVEMEEVDGAFYYLRYPVCDAAGHQAADTFITVATTRPETMLGDTAVAVNPRDPRAAALRGRFVRLPIVNRVVPIIEDDYVVLSVEHGGAPEDVKAQFATGFLKVTPAHDENDYLIGQRHKLPIINVFAPDATVSRDHGWPAGEWEEAPAPGNPAAAGSTAGRQGRELVGRVDPFAHGLLGKDRFEARALVVRWFKEHGLFEGQKPYRHSVGHSYRSHVPIEPYLSDQWYVATKMPIPSWPDEGLIAGTDVPRNSLAGLALRAMAPTPAERAGSVSARSASSERAGSVSARSDSTPHRDPLTAPLAYLITFTTYGTWLHGDERGSADRDHNLPGTLYLPPDHLREHAEFQELKHAPVTLAARQRAVVAQTITEVCSHRGWTLLAGHVRGHHVHMVVAADKTPEGVMTDLKAYATRRLREAGLLEVERVWTSHGSTRYLNSPEAVEQACQYVLEEQGSDAGGTRCESIAGSGAAAPGTEVRGEPGAYASGSWADNAAGSWEGGLHITPERYQRTFQAWHENLRDWCISRQLWWGHRIPVWRSPDPPTFPTDQEYRALCDGDRAWGMRFGSHMYVCVRDNNDHEALAILHRLGYERDPDVLDTWFSSALWPISTMGWPSDTPELKVWNPSNCLSTAREILTLWVSRMVMFNLYFRRCLPFADVFIHAMIQDGHGQKMSKSLGNGVDPLDIIHSHGSDAMRFTMASMTTQTQDVRLPVDLVCPHHAEQGETFAPKTITDKAGYVVAAPTQQCPGNAKLKMVSSYGLASGSAQPTAEMPLARNTSGKFDMGRNFANKLWNAVRFALSNLEAAPAPSAGSPPSAPGPLALADRWILTRLAHVVADTDKALAEYEFSGYAQNLYSFIWGDLCDWYIEAVKPTVRDHPGQRAVLAACLDVSLRLLHPLMPFVTERLWERLNEVAPQRAQGVTGLSIPPSELLIRARWPVAAGTLVDDAAQDDWRLLQQVTVALREVRNTYKVNPRQKMTVWAKAPATLATRLLAMRTLLEALACVECGQVGPKVDRPADAATAVVADVELYVLGLVDAGAERSRLSKRLEELNRSIGTLRGRLGSASYVAKAPPHLVRQSQEQLAAAERELQAVTQQLAGL